MASASSTDSVGELPNPDRTPPAREAPGSTTTRFVPRLSICWRTDSLAPWPTATIAINAATPMSTPSIVKIDRIVLRRTAWNDDAMTMDASAKTDVWPDRAGGAAGGVRSVADEIDVR